MRRFILGLWRCLRHALEMSDVKLSPSGRKIGQAAKAIPSVQGPAGLQVVLDGTGPTPILDLSATLNTKAGDVVSLSYAGLDVALTAGVCDYVLERVHTPADGSGTVTSPVRSIQNGNATQNTQLVANDVVPSDGSTVYQVTVAPAGGDLTIPGLGATLQVVQY